jgi:tRNA A58 N-methylase Trm61
VKPLPDIGGSFNYVFTDSDPEAVANDVTISAGSELLELPEKMSRRIAAPSSMRPISHTINSGSGDVVIRGGDGAGAMTVTLSFSRGKLARAEVDTVASDIPKVVWP